MVDHLEFRIHLETPDRVFHNVDRCSSHDIDFARMLAQKTVEHIFLKSDRPCLSKMAACAVIIEKHSGEMERMSFIDALQGVTNARFICKNAGHA